ncbi:hypothetical protein SAMD00020551_1714 [Mesobacillus selenatarsenatis SF-1]|uniref:Uncharacterized protein n=1 Tax=Mesobacillus selenatarsenatis (strain DSM 18680 / JCM 14380 / FERM P-15431 / SF-1) TaxID=1321606 RepID=A0A0A8X2S3_MESS1|nr:hypothetical protein SAMD00020551_1714 [Mesobacillus selenatarsenatis SF-1]
MLVVAGDIHEIHVLFSQGFHPTDNLRHHGRKQYLYADSHLFRSCG